MEDGDLSQMRSVEAEVADIFRAFGAKKVVLQKDLAGNQVDVYVEEETAVGTLLKTIVECKDCARRSGVAVVSDFARRYQDLRGAHLADLAVIVSRNGFTIQAQRAAEAHDITLLQLADLRERQEAMDSMNLLVVTKPGISLALKRSGGVLVVRGPLRRTRIEVGSIDEVERTKIIDRYTSEIRRLSEDPKGKIVMLDLTGSATSFKNWLRSHLYRGILTANEEYNTAYKRRYGEHAVGVIRNFIINPAHISNDVILNVQRTLEAHLARGLGAGIIYVGSKLPKELVADIGTLADRIAVDFGNIEQSDIGDGEIHDLIVPKTDRRFFRIRERVAWATHEENLDFIVTRQEDIGDVIKDMRERMERLRFSKKREA